MPDEDTQTLSPQAQALQEAIKGAFSSALEDAGLLNVKRPGITTDEDDKQIAGATIRELDEALGFTEKDGVVWDKRAKAPAEPGIRLARYVREMITGKLEKAGLVEGTGADGGFLVPEEWFQELIPLLRARVIVRASGARVIPMDTDTMLMPRVAGSGTAYWLGEAQNIPPSKQTFGQANLIAKTLAALTYFSNQLLRDSRPAVDTIVRDDLVRVIGIAEDLGFLRGDGTGNAPTGIRNISGVGTTALGGPLTYDALSDLIYQVEKENVDLNNGVFYAHARSINALRKLKDNDGRPIFEDVSGGGAANFRAGEPRYRVLGFPVYVTTGIPINLGAGTNESELYFGAADEIMIGQNMGLEVAASSEATITDGGTDVNLFQSWQTAVRCIERVDINLRHPKAFHVLTGITG